MAPSKRIRKEYGQVKGSPMFPSMASEIRGDLDWIVMKALSKEPDFRYSSVASFQNDLRNYLDNKPVAAGPPGRLYLIRKFLTRHRWPALASTVVLISLVLGLTLAIQGKRSAERAERITRTELEKNAAIKGFLGDLLIAPHPNFQGHRVTIPAALDLANENVDLRFAKQPEIQTEVRMILGRSYFGLGEFEKADRVFRRVLESENRHFPRSSTVLTDVLTMLGQTRLRLGQLESSERYLTDALERAESDDHQEQIIFIRYTLATLYTFKDEPRRAEPYYREVLEHHRSHLGERDVETAEAMSGLARAYTDMGRYEEAADLFRSALDIQISAFGAEHPRVLGIKSNQANLFLRKGEWEEAEARFREVIDARERVLGKEHPQNLDSRRGLATSLFRLGKLAEAERLSEEVVKGYDSLFGATHYGSLIARNTYAMVLIRQGKLEPAIELFREVLRASDISGLNESSYAQVARNNLGDCLIRKGKPQEAIPLLIEVVQTNRQSVGGTA